MKTCSKCGTEQNGHDLHGSPVREGEVCRPCLDEDMRMDDNNCLTCEYWFDCDDIECYMFKEIPFGCKINT